MKYRIVKLERLSGGEASIFTIYLEGERCTLFERFIAENTPEYQQELLNIVGRLRSIGERVGAREQFFKQHEGKPGDLVCALYDHPDKFLRLYCIRYGKSVIVLGGGGPKNVRSWQDDPKLSEEATWMMKVSRDICERMQQGDLKWSEDGFDFEGNLNFNDDEEV